MNSVVSKTAGIRARLADPRAKMLRIGFSNDTGNGLEDYRAWLARVVHSLGRVVYHLEQKRVVDAPQMLIVTGDECQNEL